MPARIWSTSMALLLFVARASAQDGEPPAALPSVVAPRPLAALRLPHSPANAPKYLILRQANGGVAQPTVGQPYAYGWFGVAPRRHTIVHRGYYGGLWLMPGRIGP
jgi:hypothetical protein